VVGTFTGVDDGGGAGVAEAVTAEEGSVTGSGEDAGCCVGVVGAADDGGSDVGATEGIVGLASDGGLALGGGFALGRDEGTEEGIATDVLAVPLLAMTTAGDKKKKKVARWTQTRLWGEEVAVTGRSGSVSE
jgi:hypothetical protein